MNTLELLDEAVREELPSGVGLRLCIRNPATGSVELVFGWINGEGNEKRYNMQVGEHLVMQVLHECDPGPPTMKQVEMAIVEGLMSPRGGDPVQGLPQFKRDSYVKRGLKEAVRWFVLPELERQIRGGVA